MVDKFFVFRHKWIRSELNVVLPDDATVIYMDSERFLGELADLTCAYRRVYGYGDYELDANGYEKYSKWQNSVSEHFKNYDLTVHAHNDDTYYCFITFAIHEGFLAWTMTY